jgi:hypothetical protein
MEGKPAKEVCLRGTGGLLVSGSLKKGDRFAE